MIKFIEFSSLLHNTLSQWFQLAYIKYWLKIQRFILISAFFFLIVKSEALSQCCTAGNPANTGCITDQGAENVLNISLSHIYSFSDTYYKGSEKLDYKYMESDFNFSSLTLSYGLADWLSVTGDIGYFFNKSQTFVESGYSRYARGIADAKLGLMFRAYRTKSETFEVLQSAKVILPIGKFNQEYDGVVLPIDLQASAGNYNYNFGIIFLKRFDNGRFSVISANNIEFSEFIETESSLHKYGNLYNLSLIGTYKATDFMTGFLQMRGEIREKALNGSKTRSNSYSYLNSTGGFILFVSPQVIFKLYQDLLFSLQYNHPVYKNINGEQLTNKFSVMANISKSFSFSGSKQVLVPNPEEKATSSVKIHVRGKCEMCKDRIESTVNEFKNVSSSSWNSESEMLTIFYKTELPDIDGIEKALSLVGHDTEKYKAKDEVYSKLPKCCHYRDK